MLDPERRHALHGNEVVWTDEFAQICADQVIRKCHVRWFSKDTVLSGNIPVPYNRRGNGDFFFLTRSRIRSRENGMRLEFLTKPPVSLTQGPDFEAKPRVEPLRGLSIFGGSGNLDRGLEEGGAVEFHTVVDFNPVAIHTQKANARNPEKLNLYCWSVDDFLKALLSKKLVIDKVELIAGGAPCPGFSLLQKDPFGENSCRQASHITTICSFVDLLRPLYGIFENVPSMASTRKGYEEDNILSQVVACFVAMGYQVRYDILDAWSYSSVQRRDRLFLYVAAPGLEPLDSPWHTHSHPETILGRSLGKGPNGLSLGDREDYATPFPFTTAQEAISDLPDIGQGCLQACISHPDHRTAPTSLRDRIIMRNIPVYPPAQGYAEAMELGLIPKTVTRERSEVGKSYRRMQRHGLIPTVTTTMDAQNSRSSGVLHYEQHRPVTLEECKRAQGFLKYDVLIGNYSQALRTTGNAVDRNVALIVGILLRQALEKSYLEKEYTPSFPQNHDPVVEKRRAVSARLPRPRQEVSRPRLEVSNHNNITTATRFETLALNMCTIFRGDSTKETQSSALSSLESTPQPRTANSKKDNTIDNDLSLLSDEEEQTSVYPSSEATPQPTQAKRSRDYIRTISTTEESAPIKKTRHSEQQSKYRSTAIRHKEARHRTIRSVYSETRKVTIHIQHSVSERETINGEPSHSTKRIRDTVGDQHSLTAHNRETVDRHEVMDLTKGESEEAPLAKKALRPAARKHKRDSENDSYSTPAIESRNRTRGSGHQVEFTPIHWNKRPESMLRNKKD
jgi:DNA (cytosine-5)-methyltransferase 1